MEQNRKTMAANKFVSRHCEIDFEHSIGLNPGIPALAFSDGRSVQESCIEADLTADETALPELLSRFRCGNQSIPAARCPDSPARSDIRSEHAGKGFGQAGCAGVASRIRPTYG
jgi:hypothetical protein